MCACRLTCTRLMLCSGKTAEQEFYEWGIQQGLIHDTLEKLKLNGVASKPSLQFASDEFINNAMVQFLPTFQLERLQAAKASLGGPQLPASSSAPNMIEPSSDNVDGR